MCSQPTWELVYATDYSALYRDATGVYAPELAIVQTDDNLNDEDEQRNLVYRFSLDRCWQATRDDGSTVLVDGQDHAGRVRDRSVARGASVSWRRDA
jgi:hypothetical protein